MGTLALLAWLTAAAASPEVQAEEVAPAPAPLAVEAEPVAKTLEEPPAGVEPAPSPPTDAERWPGEEKRVHWAAGVRIHLGLMYNVGSVQLVSESGLYGVFRLRAFRHQEFRVQVEISGGIPNWLGGETNFSYRWPITQRIWIGVGVPFFIGLAGFRTGVEIPFAVRLGASRRHEVGLSLRATAGAFNNSTFTWYDFKRQRFAFTGDATLGYTFLF